MDREKTHMGALVLVSPANYHATLTFLVILFVLCPGQRE